MNTDRITLWIVRHDGFGGGTVSSINLSLQEVCNRFNEPDAGMYSDNEYFTTKEFAEDYLAKWKLRVQKMEEAELKEMEERPHDPLNILRREMRKPLSELTSDDKKEIQMLRAYASGLIDTGEEKEFEGVMKTIDSIRTRGR